MYLIDYHMHTTRSTDGKSSVVEMCEQAIVAGLREIAITEHFEPVLGKNNRQCYDPFAAWAEARYGRLKYFGRLKVRFGIELGQPHHFPEDSEYIISSVPYDYIIGSAHKFGDGLDVSQIDYEHCDLGKVIDDYLDELYELIRWGNFDCVGHFDLIKRYAAPYFEEKISFMKHRDKIEHILKMLIEGNKGLEINTSALRQAACDTLPGLDILKLYYALGGRILTVGSDAHDSRSVGKGIKKGYELAKEAGFSYITVFENRIPKWVSLDAGCKQINKVS